jgi:hypothetical protein
MVSSAMVGEMRQWTTSNVRGNLHWLTPGIRPLCPVSLSRCDNDTATAARFVINRHRVVTALLDPTRIYQDSIKAPIPYAQPILGLTLTDRGATVGDPLWECGFTPLRGFCDTSLPRKAAASSATTRRAAQPPRARQLRAPPQVCKCESSVEDTLFFSF